MHYGYTHANITITQFSASHNDHYSMALIAEIFRKLVEKWNFADFS